MKWLRAEVRFESTDPETTAFLITEVFEEFGLKGVIIESPDTDPDLDWAEDALCLPDHHAVIGFFPEEFHDGERRKRFEERIGALRPAGGWEYRIAYDALDEEDWAESWKAHFHPVRIDERIVVKPTWEDFAAGPEELVIEIDPGMAFGTGTHPTTALCIRMIHRWMAPGIRFLDIGTGSGILMIAAAKLGAAELTGVDSDPVAVSVAGENLRLNGMAPDRFALVTGNLVDAITGNYDLISANILSETIRELVPHIGPRLVDGGIFIASGIITEKAPMVLDTLRQYGFEILETAMEDDWVAIVAKKPA